MSIYHSLGYDECVRYVQGVVSNLPSDTDLSRQWIVFDVDQTLLTDEKFRHLYTSQGDVFKYQYRGDHNSIVPMVNLYNWCVSLGIKVCIITGRNSALHSITQKNLIKVGIRKCDRIYTKKHREDTIKYKSRCRKEIIDTGDSILVNIGDQEADLLCSDTGTYGYAQHSIKLPSTY